MAQLRIALAQVDTTVGDLAGNCEMVLRRAAEAAERGAHLVAFPEMTLTGYPPEDLVFRESFLSASCRALAELAGRLAEAGLGEIAVMVGDLDADGSPRNAAALLHGGTVVARYFKHHLPNYGVFDEARYFVRGDRFVVVRLRGVDVALTICEDMWQDGGPLAVAGRAEVALVLNINGSPYERNKDDVRLPLGRRRAAEAGATLAYVNMVGAQDELVYDGGSFVVAADGTLLARAAQYEQALLVVDLDLPRRPGTVTGDVLGMAVERHALPGPAADPVPAYPSEPSLPDAAELARRLGCDFPTGPIGPMVDAYLGALALSGLAEENVQSRVRGTTLMALSNRNGHLVLATGNKSELSVGYSTLYGDSVGGYAPLKDVPKTLVWRLARWRNAAADKRGEPQPIPENTISKPPSAELRPGQLDTDSLPSYDLLDAVLADYVDRDLGWAELVAAGHDPAVVERVIQLVDRAEYKRRQYPPGPKISLKAFGRDRRLPISSRWNETAPGQEPIPDERPEPPGDPVRGR